VPVKGEHERSTPKGRNRGGVLKGTSLKKRELMVPKKGRSKIGLLAHQKLTCRGYYCLYEQKRDLTGETVHTGLSKPRIGGS